MRAIIDLISKRLFLIVVMMSFSVMAFSQDTVLPSSDIVSGVMTFLISIPKFGPMISTFIYWIGAIAGFFTALTIFSVTVLKIPQVVARFKGAHDLADKIEKFSIKVSYYLKYFSIFNAQKEVKK